MNKSLYTNMGLVLQYPREDIKEKVDGCINALAESGCPAALAADVRKELQSFKNDVERLSLDALQELYSYTFELVSDTTLDIGYFLYAGQDGFKRARNLVTIKAMYREQGFPFEEIAKGELPDNLTVILQFLGFIDSDELRSNFMKTFVVVAMEKLNRNFQNKKNAYRHLVNATYKIIDNSVKEVK